MASAIKITGSLDWSMGVDSNKSPTVQSARNPNGLSPQSLHWLVNASVRGGMITPRDGVKPKGNINGNLGSVTLPGTPGETIPQPPIPPIQTPSPQNVAAIGTWVMPAVGASVTLNLSAPYVGNVGDVQNVSWVVLPLGTFLVTAFTSNSITLLCQSNEANTGFIQPNSIVFTLVTLGPSTPQPPIIIPPGPPTIIPAVPIWQGQVNPLYSPNGPDSFSPNGTPYGICVIGGHVVAYDPDFNTPPLDLSQVWDLVLPSDTPKCFFQQAEKYLIIQAGDYDPVTGNGTLPLIWDGQQLTQSNGITGVTVRGAAQPKIFQLTTVDAWHIPNAPTVTTTPFITLAAPYPGNLYDNISLYDLTNALIGTFRVVGIQGNTVQFFYIAGTPLQAISANTTLNAVYYNAVPTSVAVNIGAGFWNVPAVGNKGAVTLTSLYFGSYGDTITVNSLDGSVNYGSFTVVSLNSTFQLVLKTISSNYAGQQVSEASFLVTVTAARTFSFRQGQDANWPWVIQPVGGTSNLTWPEHSSPYPGKTYDIVNVTSKDGSVNYGTFRVVPFPPSVGFKEQVGLETIQSNYIGSRFGSASPRLTVVVPPSNPQVITLNSGQWTVPPVGSSVSLQIVWNPAQSVLPYNYAFPGSIGDQIEFINNSPVYNLGTFTVTSFDSQGNITLNTVLSSYVGTTVVGPTSGAIQVTQVPSTTGTNINQIPAATEMAYYQGILWYAKGDIISGGDVVGGASGTSANNYTDSVLCVTENPLAIGGDGFKLPIPGNITGMAWPAQINASLGQGLLYIGTLNGICSLQVPANRASWISANANNMPQMNVVQFDNGWVSGTSIVSINGDLYFPDITPSIRSLIQAQRYFQQQGNKSISSNESRILKYVNTGLLSFSSGIFFNNRLLMAMYPQKTVNGVIHTAVIPLDMEPVSSLAEELNPAWEGQQESLQIFQMVTGKFNGVWRAFAVTLNTANAGEIDLWEIVKNAESDANFDGTERRIKLQLITPCWTWDKEDELKKLVAADIWIDKLKGIVAFEMEYRPDSSERWLPWKKWQVCSARNSSEKLFDPQVYPIVDYPPGYRQPMTLPEPKAVCAKPMKRPSTVAMQFQFRLTWTGYCRVRGLFFKAEMVDKSLYEDLIIC